VSVEVLEKCLDRVALAIDRAGKRGAVYLPILALHVPEDPESHELRLLDRSRVDDMLLVTLVVGEIDALCPKIALLSIVGSLDALGGFLLAVAGASSSSSKSTMHNDSSKPNCLTCRSSRAAPASNPAR